MAIAVLTFVNLEPTYFHSYTGVFPCFRIIYGGSRCGTMRWPASLPFTCFIGMRVRYSAVRPAVHGTRAFACSSVLGRASLHAGVEQSLVLTSNL